MEIDNNRIEMVADCFTDEWYKEHRDAKEAPRLKRELDAAEGQAMLKKDTPERGQDSRENGKERNTGPKRGGGGGGHTPYSAGWCE